MINNIFPLYQKSVITVSQASTEHTACISVADRMVGKSEALLLLSHAETKKQEGAYISY